MVFSSLTFLFVFLPIVLLIYYISPRPLKNFVILLFSLIFYAWGEPKFIFLIILSILINYIGALQIVKNSSDTEKRKFIFITLLLIDISILFFFKYYGFIISSIGSLFGIDLVIRDIPLPLGISFYTFQQISYIIDVYTKKTKVQKNLINFAAYITMFPQLIAGPIVKYNDIEGQLKNRNENLTQFSSGVHRFIIGLGKKVLLANSIGALWSEIKVIPLNEISILTSWIGIIAFALQIYFDFSGYSDMAIGLAKMFGFEFLENFNYPYISKSVTEFWRRWHISVGTWFREYLYIPLGGNKKGNLIQIRNLFVVWFTTGLWHGASFNFIAWGIYFGVILFIEKIIFKNILNKLPSFLCHIYTLILVLIGWVIFDMNTLSSAMEYISIMFGLSNNLVVDKLSLFILSNNIVILLIGIICSTTLLPNVFKKLRCSLKKSNIFIIISMYLIIFILSISYLVGESFNPFLYFRF
nr:MBOAT family O-acyltransferase [uncultured Clostridium sp.]